MFTTLLFTFVLRSNEIWVRNPPEIHTSKDALLAGDIVEPPPNQTETNLARGHTSDHQSL